MTPHHQQSFRSLTTRRTILSLGIASLLAIAIPRSNAAVSFLGVAAGDASSSDVTLWTRAADDVAATGAFVTAQIATDIGFTNVVATASGTSVAANDYTLKFDVTALQPATLYYYRFQSGAVTSIVGRFKTAPLATAAVPVHFAFSGDNDGLMRPYALATVVPAQNLDFYMNLGDVIYETASNLTASGTHNGATWLNSPAVTLSNAALTLNGIPVAGTTFATHAQLYADYSRKYRENFLPVNTAGQNSLQVLYAAQGNYTTWDNHELGNRKYIDGGAPAGGSVGGPAGTDMPTGRGVDARAYTGSNTGGSGNVNNVNDVNTSATDFMNRALGFLTLEQVFLDYQPIADRGTINAPTDPRTHGTKQLFSAHQWGLNALFVNTDSRSYRDIRLKTANAAADDTSAPRANDPSRTYLGQTQLAWLEQTLLDAQTAGTPWKFVSISDPVDQLGPIGGALTGALTSVNADGGKSFIGGYRAERNALLKFIADNHITNVVFLSTDDHQNRINEIAYSPTGQTEAQSSYVKVPYCFSIVCGPLGATGPDAITDHSFGNIKAIADSVANAEVAVGVEPIGLESYPGLHDLFRAGDPSAGTTPQPVDFYSPDTFNFTVLDVDAAGTTLAVTSIGMNSTAQNSGLEYGSGPQAGTVFSFKVDAAPTVESVQINDGSSQRSKIKDVTVTLNGIIKQSDIATGAFTLVQTGGGVFTVGVQSVAVVGRQTLVTLGFAGATVGLDGSLPDGSYSLRVDRSKIPLDSPSPVAEIETFQSLFGDLNGDGHVDGSEVAASAHANGARRSSPDYLWYLDFDANGLIDGKDHREVARRNGGH